LEEDLKLQKKALDAYKNFITTGLDKVSLLHAWVTCTISLNLKYMFLPLFCMINLLL
jgi:hypothetical protein